VLFAESILNSLRPNCVLERVENSSRVRVVIRTFRVIPQQVLSPLYYGTEGVLD
jgi:hypothetical protein